MNKLTRPASLFSILLLCASIAILCSNSLVQNWMHQQKLERITNTIFSDSQSTEETSSTLITQLKELNTESIGWISIDGTAISYPIVIHSDNSFYLTTGFDLAASCYGSIFMDYRNSSCFTDLHTIIYGHNMKDGSMFHDLIQYKAKSYYEEHKEIEIQTDTCILTYQIFAVYVVDADEETIPLAFDSADSYKTYVMECYDRSLYKTDACLTINKPILTLVTCSYETDNSRILVQAQLTED